MNLIKLILHYFDINTSEYGFPYCGPTRPPGTMICRNLNLHYIRKLSCKYYLFWLSGSKEDFWITLPHFCNYLPFEEDLALYLNTLEFPLPKDDLYEVWLKLVCWFWRRFFFNINTCKYGFPYCGPTQPLDTMMWTILNLHYIRKFSCKYDLLWLIGFGEEGFYMISPHICIFVIISPLKRNWPFIWTINYSLYPKIIYIKFDWNSLAGSGEEDSYVIMVFPILAPSDPWEPWCEQLWIYIISESFHVNMNYSGSVVLEEKIFKWLHPNLAFL
jgi:hypothetical protein